nr:hypothetical protein [Tanacetum cinerariifolium]
MHPPSPGYVPGPEYPPSPVYVPYVLEPVYPEFMPPEDDVPLAKEQLLHTEEDDEDPEEYPADYPADRDDDDEEESSRDDADNEDEDEGEDKEEDEEEHLAPANFVPLPAYRTTTRMSIRAQTPIPFPSETKSCYDPVESRVTSASHSLPPPPPIVLPCTKESMVMMRAAAPSTYILVPQSGILPSGTPPSGRPPLLPIPLPTSSPPLLLPFTNDIEDVFEVMLSPQKRLCIALGPRFEVGECSSAPIARPTRGFRSDYGFVGTFDVEIKRDLDREIGYRITDVGEDPDEIVEEIPTTDVAELGQRMTDFVTTVRQDTNEIYRRLDDAHDDRLLMSGQLNLLHKDMRSYVCTSRFIESEAKASREAWVQSMDASDTVRSETQMVALHRPARDPTHPDVLEEAGSSS